MTTFDTSRGLLSVRERDRTWKSTFNGAEYRWADVETGWEVRTSIADWHQVKPGRAVATVYAGAGERFVEA